MRDEHRQVLRKTKVLTFLQQLAGLNGRRKMSFYVQRPLHDAAPTQMSRPAGTSGSARHSLGFRIRGGKGALDPVRPSSLARRSPFIPEGASDPPTSCNVRRYSIVIPVATSRASARPGRHCPHLCTGIESCRGLFRVRLP